MTSPPPEPPANSAAPATGLAPAAASSAVPPGFAAWQSMLESLGDPAWLVAADTLALAGINAAARRLFGVRDAPIEGLLATALIATPEDLAFWDDVRAGHGGTLQSQAVAVAPDGRLLHLERRVSPLRMHGAPVTHYLVMARDHSEQTSAAQDRERLVAELQATLESTADGILVTDLAGRIRACNRRFAQLWDLPHKLLGDGNGEGNDKAVFDWMCRSVSEPLVYRRHLAAMQSSALGTATQALWLRSGRTLECVTQPQLSQGRPIGRVWAFRDRTELVAADRRIKALITTDTLTNLPNRRHLRDALALACRQAEREHTGFALLLLDLDRFKQINDSLGSETGDRVLVEVAERARTCLRQGDLLARVGGDQFAMLVHRADLRGAEAAAARVLDAISRAYGVDGSQFTLTCSIGIALYPADEVDGNELMRHAETAMHRAKQSGRANFRFHQPSCDADLRSRMQLEHAMRQALTAQRFRLEYQPQVELGDGAVIGAEALLRWRDPELGDVSPAQFIPVAEESGFIVALGEWVLVQAVRQAAQWRDKGLPTKVAVNVSALQFQQPDFVDRVAAALHEVDLPGDLLELELTESLLLRDAREALQRLQALSQLGVKLAIDDFGTGYSSLAYLKRFPIHKLKIDRSFIRGTPRDESDVAIVQAVIQLARALNLRINAEGVESEAQRHFLRQAGCDEVQGFLYAPALDPLRFERQRQQSVKRRHLRPVRAASGA